ncbi:MAG: sugar ABC transporter substrate-binding protein [Lachnospiraceae bacterium]
MKKAIAALLGISMVISLAACGGTGSASSESSSVAETSESASAETSEAATEEASEAAVTSDLKLAWYAPAPHPYFEEVQKGVEKFAEEQGVEVTIQIGPDWTQASENEKVEALVAQGINAISIYPCDASGANGLYDEISSAMGVNIVNFGTDTAAPSKADFAVATDVKQAAYDATEAVIKMMGEKGNILNVLEVLEDPNTALRKEGVEECVAKYPDVTIIQEIAGIKSQEEAVSKIESALSANVGNIDGIVCTGLITSVGMSQTLSDYYEKQGADDHIYAIGIDTDEGVMNAIKDGTIDGTIAQNPLGHGYISCMLLKYMAEGYQAKEGEYFIDSGAVLVTNENIDTYQNDLDARTTEIVDSLLTVYMEK